MPYAHYSADDFIRDEFFQQWVFLPTQETQAFWQDFLTQHPYQRETIEEARQFLRIMDLEGGVVAETRISGLKHRIEQAIYQSSAIEESNLPEKEVAPKRLWQISPSIAAVVGLLFILFSFYWLNQNKSWHPAFSAKNAAKEQTSPKGKRSLLTLPDGTRVWLNADTRLTYPRDFNRRAVREVFLEGEAYFDVVENKHRPFIVRTAALSIRVLGTAFNVKSYASDETIETTLVRGKVSIEANQNKTGEIITLLPHQQAVFKKKSSMMVLANQVNTETYTAWRTGKLVFDDSPFSEIIPMLERWYGVKIHMADQHSLDCRFSAKIDNKTLSEVQDLFKTSDTITYQMKGNDVYITGKLCEEE